MSVTSEDAQIPHVINSIFSLPVFPFGRICVCLSPAGSSVDGFRSLEDARITHAFNSILILIDWWHHLSYYDTFRI